MAKNKVGELVLKAKGDRSYREYQRESGVDAAIISKIVKGTYIPKNPQIYRKLTSCDSNGVTFEELIDAANFSAEYKNGMAAGIATSQAAMTALGMGAASLAILPGIGPLLGGLATGVLLKASSNKTKNIDKVEEYLNDIQRFSAISNGILFSRLAQNGIVFRQNTETDIRLFENQMDTYLDIDNQSFSQYIIRYLYIDMSLSDSEKLIEMTGRRIIEELVFSNPEKGRKISIVMDSKHAFEYLKRSAGKISFKGNLSIILLDTQKVEFVEESILSIFDSTIDSDALVI